MQQLTRHACKNSFKNGLHGQKFVTFRLLFQMAKVKKSNFQATLPYCTPVLVRKTAPKRFGTKENNSEHRTSSKIGC